MRWSSARAPTTLTPKLSEIRSAGVSRTACAVKPSTIACPANPRLTSSRSASSAAVAGQAHVGSCASVQWLIELPWCTHTGRPLGAAGSTGASPASPIRSTTIACGSQIVTVLRPDGSPVSVTSELSRNREMVAPVPSGEIRSTWSVPAGAEATTTPSTVATTSFTRPTSSRSPSG